MAEVQVCGMANRENEAIQGPSLQQRDSYRVVRGVARRPATETGPFLRHGRRL